DSKGTSVIAKGRLASRNTSITLSYVTHRQSPQWVARRGPQLSDSRPTTSNTSPKKLTEAQRVEVVRLAEETQLVEAARRARAVELATALAKGTKNTPRHLGHNVVPNVLFE
ncbi:hypothetical protein HAX54_005945, partial [Datura stramonium]|nr:hypothetical protein [Datura stramonium]